MPAKSPAIQPSMARFRPSIRPAALRVSGTPRQSWAEIGVCKTANRPAVCASGSVSEVTRSMTTGIPMSSARCVRKSASPIPIKAAGCGKSARLRQISGPIPAGSPVVSASLKGFRYVCPRRLRRAGGAARVLFPRLPGSCADWLHIRSDVPRRCCRTSDVRVLR